MAKIHVKIEQFFLFINVFVSEYFDEEVTREEVTQARYQVSKFVTNPFSRRSMLMLCRLWLILETDAVIQTDIILSQLRQLVAETTTESNEYAVR
jgi:hypothetical protein